MSNDLGGAGGGSGAPTPYSVKKTEPTSSVGSSYASQMGAGQYPTYNWRDWNQTAQSAAQQAYASDSAQLQQGYANSIQDQALAGLTSQQNNDLWGVDKNYIGQQKGFANQGADLAHQLLGVDSADLGLRRSDLGISRSDLGIDRKDYARDWAMRQWQMENELAGRGAMVTPGSRTQHEDMTQQLALQNQRFDNQGRRLDNEGYRIDNEGRRIGIRGQQIDLNLSEQLAGLDHQLESGDIQNHYDDLSEALQMQGYQDDQVQYLLGMAANDANVAAMVSQLLGIGPPGGMKYQAPTHNPDNR